MFKFVVWVLKLLPFLLWNYFRYIIPYSRHPEKYPLQERYDRVRYMILKCLKTFKVKIHVNDFPKNSKRYYFVVNHVSLLDPVVLIASSKEPILFIAKKQTRNMMFVGQMFRAIDGLFLDRGNLRQEIKVYGEIKKWLNEDISNVTLFPEGTRNKSYNAPLNEFKPGSLKPAFVTDTSILPVVVWGTQFVLNKRYNYKRYNVYINFLEEVDPKEYKDTVTLAKDLEDTMQAKVNEARDFQKKMLGHKLTKRQIKHLNS